MKPKVTVPTILLLAVMLMFVNAVYAQSLRDIINAKKEQLKKKKDQVVKDIIGDNKKDSASGTTHTTTTENTKTTTATDQTNSPVENETAGTTDRPKLSEISDADFVQNAAIPPKDNNDTWVRIAGNLAIKMKGKYPVGYSPKWRFITEKSPLRVTVENWMHPNSNVQYENYPLSIGSYNNVAVLRLQPFRTCECFADIVVKGGIAVINEIPQTFQITNFRKILNERSTGEPCVSGANWSNSWEFEGGFEGKITLSANENGDLLMNFMLENYSADHKNRKGELTNPSQVSRRYIAKNITIENEMTTTKANDIVRKEQEAKQRQKEYIAKMTKQSDSLQKVINNKYPGNGAKDCFVRNSNSSLKVTPTTTVYTNGYGDVVGTSSGSDWDVNTKTSIKNNCNYPITFVGIQQLHDEVNGYYLKEVTKTMEAGYNYSSDQELMSTLFTSFIGGGSEFNIAVQDKYVITSAYVGAVQWLKVIKN